MSDSKNNGFDFMPRDGKLSIEVIQQGSLANIIVEATIRDQIIVAQKENKGIAHIKERIKNGKAECFKVDDEGVL